MKNFIDGNYGSKEYVDGEITVIKERIEMYREWYREEWISEMQMNHRISGLKKVLEAMSIWSKHEGCCFD